VQVLQNPPLCSSIINIIPQQTLIYCLAKLSVKKIVIDGIDMEIIV
jgi:hypothetical protein